MTQRRFLLVFALAIFVAGVAVAPKRPPRRLNLTVKLSGFDERKGTLKLGLYNSEATFQQSTFLGVELPGKARGRTHTFKDLPRGHYAIAVYQDVNGNGSLDRHVTGYPSEPFGFSNNPRVVFGPPKWEECAVELLNRSTSVEIKVQ